MKPSVYAGTFDPITNGHVDIIKRAASIFDRVYVAVAESTSKQVMFPIEQRVEMVKDAIADANLGGAIVVEPFSGLLVDYARRINVQVIIRGLRAVSDYEYEAQMAHINRHLDESMETVFLVTSKQCAFISSSIVKNVAANGGDVSGLVPTMAAKRLSGK